MTVQGIVIGDFQQTGSTYNDDKNIIGFFIQSAINDVDNNPLTSEGLFVYEGGLTTTDVSFGDNVRVVGTVSERNGMTTIQNIQEISILKTNAHVPPPTGIVLSAGPVDLEQYEGMLVTFNEAMTITQQTDMPGYNRIVMYAGASRPRQFTQENLPSSPSIYDAHISAVESRSIMYEYGLNGQVFGNSVSTATVPRNGDQVVQLTGVLYDESPDYRIRSVRQNSSENVLQRNNTRPGVPSIGGTHKLVAYNMVNFFTTLRDTWLSQGKSGGSGPNNAEPNGAYDSTEFNRQLEKITSTLSELNPDIVGLVGLENEFGDQNGDGVFAIGMLVDEWNKATGGAYAYVNPGVAYLGTGSTAVGFIYNSKTVQLQGNPAILDSSVDSTFLDTLNRPSLAQTFKSIVGTASNDCITLAVNNFKSKETDCGSIAPDVDDGQGFCNGVRTQAAAALAYWLATDPTGQGCRNVAILGDLNAYAKEDPIQALETAGYTSLEGVESYGYVQDGQLGTLDYILTNSALSSLVTGTQTWHVNADESEAIDYDLESGQNSSIFDGAVPYRSTSHDPLIVGMTLASNRRNNLRHRYS